MPVVFERIDVHRWADVDIALETIAARDPRARLVGVGGGDRHHMSLSDLMANAEWGRFRQGQVDRLSVAVGPDSERATVAFGLHLFTYQDEPVLVLQRGHNPQHGGEARVEIITSKPEVASRLLADWVILPAGTLDQVRSHVVGLAEHREQLRSKGQHLKRGILLYGPPGTGKTHTVRHLIGAVPETTVVLLSGTNLVHVGNAAQIARAHQPAIVVLEDCDLIAEDRDHGQFGGGASPLLFTLLDAMDGLDQDADVVFLLTTNRAEALERALAQRPGRVDLAVEIPLPDAAARRALIGLYAAEVGFGEDAIADAADASEGTTASYAKELVRRAVLLAAMAGHEPADDDLVAASQELRSDNAVLTRALLGSE
jgi:energy-coupling factor transporter ATP-binding protein EcfA2